jgi:hypothetical protein
MVTREQALEIALDWLTRQLREQLAVVEDFLQDRSPSMRAADPADTAIPAWMRPQAGEPDTEPQVPTDVSATSTADVEPIADDTEALMFLTPGQELQLDMERWRRPAPHDVPGQRVWRVRVAQEHLSTNMPPDILVNQETGEIVSDPWRVREG